MSAEYNGWTNWETWNTNRWMSNDEYLYPRTLRVVDAADCERLARETFPAGTPDMESDADFDSVDWEELYRAWAE